MSLKETYKQLRELLNNITTDLEKAENGNKAASQRVRTGTVRLEKIAKLYRKESIVSERKNKGQKKTSKSASSSRSSSSKSSSKSKGSEGQGSKAKSQQGASQGGNSKSSGAKGKSSNTKTQAKSGKASVKPRQLSIKRATAKLPTKRVSV